MSTNHTMGSLFKTESGRQEVLALYDQKLQALQIDYESLLVGTSFGPTHLIVTGNPANPPLIVVHGANGCAPIALETYANLHNDFRVYAVDVLAQPNKSAEVRLSMKDDSYGKWMHEVMEALALQEVVMAGFSLGGLVMLKTLEYSEENIKEVFLAAPAYIVNGNPLKALRKVFLPMRRFMRTQKPVYVEKFLDELFTVRDPFAIE